jgi:GR25 family glycosyltransferase involved in LPS biosynthesis
MALKEGYSSIVVFEDDIKINNVTNFKKKLGDFVDHIPETFDIAYVDLAIGRKSKIKGNDYVSKILKNIATYGTWAVAYSDKGIKKLLDFSLYTYPIDLFLNSKNSLKASSKQLKQEKDWLELYVASEDLLDVSGDNSTIFEMGRY